MSASKIFSIISCLVTLGGAYSWFVMHSPSFLLYASVAYVALYLVQALLKICTLQGFLIDAVAFAAGYLVGSFFTTPNWIIGCLFMLIYGFICNLLNASTGR